jgi:hypothetical protein
MGFKTQPSFNHVVTNWFANIPRRVSGKPVLPPHDPEICSTEYQTFITEAFKYVADHVVDIDLMGGECVTLAACLAGKTISSLEISCAYCTGGKENSAASNASHKTIELCLSNFGATLNQNTVNGLVFRELIRMCGGMELDAWGLDSYFSYVTHPLGGTVYLSVPQAVLQFMCDGSTQGVGGQQYYRAGTFLVWAPGTGVLYAKKIDPSASSGWTTTGTSLIGITGQQYWHKTC